MYDSVRCTLSPTRENQDHSALILTCAPGKTMEATLLVQLLVRCISHLLASLQFLSLKLASTKATVSAPSVSPALFHLLFYQVMCQIQAKRINVAGVCVNISDLSSVRTPEFHLSNAPAHAPPRLLT